VTLVCNDNISIYAEWYTAWHVDNHFIESAGTPSPQEYVMIILLLTWTYSCQEENSACKTACILYKCVHGWFVQCFGMFWSCTVSSKNLNCWYIQVIFPSLHSHLWLAPLSPAYARSMSGWNTLQALDTWRKQWSLHSILHFALTWWITTSQRIESRISWTWHTHRGLRFLV